MSIQSVDGTIIRGHRVASGLAPDSPYPHGTIEMQAPFFAARGLDISGYFPATLNVSISPYTFVITCALRTLHNVRWFEGIPAETFSFVSCTLLFREYRYESLIYYPHPETKPDHFQSPSTIEVLAPHIDCLSYGDRVIVLFDNRHMEIRGS